MNKFDFVLLLSSVLSSGVILALVYTPVRDISAVLLPEKLAGPFVRLLYLGTFIVSVVTAKSTGASHHLYRNSTSSVHHWIEAFGRTFQVSAFMIFFIMLLFAFAALGLVRAQIIAGRGKAIIDEI